MATIYVKFQSSSNTVHSHDCTTRWPDEVGCSIPMSGLYKSKYTNLMKMTGLTTVITSWISENPGKVVKITESQANIIGQTISPEGTERMVREEEDGVLCENTYTAGLFTMADGQSWELTDSVEV